MLTNWITIYGPEAVMDTLNIKLNGPEQRFVNSIRKLYQIHLSNKYDLIIKAELIIKFNRKYSKLDQYLIRKQVLIELDILKQILLKDPFITETDNGHLSVYRPFGQPINLEHLNQPEPRRVNSIQLILSEDDQADSITSLKRTIEQTSSDDLLQI